MPTQAPINTDTLASLAAEIAQTDGDFTTAIPGLKMFRRSLATTPMACMYGLGLAVTVQGGKRVMLGDEVFDYGPGDLLVTSLDLPVVSHVTQASAAEPFLGVLLELDARAIAQQAADIDFPAPRKLATARALSVVTLDAGLREALTRLIHLLREPAMIPLLAPLIQQEIIVRLLHGQHGATLRHLVASGSPSQQIAKVISWLKQHYTDEVPMADLAARAHMSPSTFRQHFRTITGMSPLQYVKQLRLQEARQLMMNDNLDAGSAAVRVGYESASQFSREYCRLFGEPPQRDIRRIKGRDWPSIAYPTAL
jgi:AraC-like DNA-binding protein